MNHNEMARKFDRLHFFQCVDNRQWAFPCWRIPIPFSSLGFFIFMAWLSIASPSFSATAEYSPLILPNGKKAAIFEGHLPGSVGSLNVLAINTLSGTETRIDTDMDGHADYRKFESGAFTVEEMNPSQNIYSKIVITKRDPGRKIIATFYASPMHRRYDLVDVKIRKRTKLYSTADKAFNFNLEDTNQQQEMVRETNSVKLDRLEDSFLAENNALCALREIGSATDSQWKNFAVKIQTVTFLSDPVARQLISPICERLAPKSSDSLIKAFAENLFPRQIGDEHPKYISCLAKIPYYRGKAATLLSKNWMEYRLSPRSEAFISCVPDLGDRKQATFSENQNGRGKFEFSQGFLNQNDQNPDRIASVLFHELVHSTGVDDEREVNAIQQCCTSGYSASNPNCKGPSLDEISKLKDGLADVVRRSVSTQKKKPNGVLSDLKSFAAQLEKDSIRDKCTAKDSQSADCKGAVLNSIEAAVKNLRHQCDLLNVAPSECARTENAYRDSLISPTIVSCVLMSHDLDGSCFLKDALKLDERSSLVLATNQDIGKTKAGKIAVGKTGVKNLNDQSISNRGQNGNTPGQGVVDSLSQDPAITVASMQVSGADPTSVQAMQDEAARSERVVESAGRQAKRAFDKIDFNMSNMGLVPAAQAASLPRAGVADESAGMRNLNAMLDDKPLASGIQPVQVSMPFQDAPANANLAGNAGGGRADGSFTGNDSSSPGQSGGTVGGRANGSRALAAGAAGRRADGEFDGNAGGVDSGGSGGGGSGGGGPVASGSGGGRLGSAAKKKSLGTRPGRSPDSVANRDGDGDVLPARNLPNPSAVKSYLKESSGQIGVIINQKWFQKRLSELKIQIVDRAKNGQIRVYGAAKENALFQWNTLMFSRAGGL